MKTKIFTFIFLIFITQNTFAYNFTVPQIFKNTTFCTKQEKLIGYNIDAVYIKEINRIYDCFEKEDTQEWREYVITHETGHAFYYTALTDEGRKQIDKFFDYYTKNNLIFPSDYSKQNKDEFFAEVYAKVKL